MVTKSLLSFAAGLALGLPLTISIPAHAQERLPWNNGDRVAQDSPYDNRRDLPDARPGYDSGSAVTNDRYSYYGNNSAPRAGTAPPSYSGRQDDSYHPPQPVPRYDSPPPAPYAPPPGTYGERGDPGYAPTYRGAYNAPPPPPERYGGYNGYERHERYDDGTFSIDEIRDAGHGFFGSVSKGLANVIEYAFRKQGRPNGYILGEDAGGAFVAGLRYGEGRLYTRDMGNFKVFWQGPSVGYDAGAEGSKVMVLVYNLRDPSDIYRRFGGVAGSAYFVGGVGMTFQTHGDIVLAPIRSGIGLRFGANIGYLKYTRRPTWNPF